jgi:hypothetical protein
VNKEKSAAFFSSHCDDAAKQDVVDTWAYQRETTSIFLEGKIHRYDL